MKQKTWRLGEVWSCEAFPFPFPTEMGHSQIWRPLLDYRWKTEGNNAPLEVFCSAEIVLSTTACHFILFIFVAILFPAPTEQVFEKSFTNFALRGLAAAYQLYSFVTIDPFTVPSAILE